MPQNLAVLDFWMQACGQWRYDFDGPVAVDWPAVFTMAEFTGFDDVMTVHDWHKLRALERAVLEDAARRHRED